MYMRTCRRGPGLLLFAMRVVMLTSALSLAVLLMYIGTERRAGQRHMLLLAILPVLDVLVASPRRWLPALVIATSVDQMRRRGACMRMYTYMHTYMHVDQMRRSCTRWRYLPTHLLTCLRCHPGDVARDGGGGGAVCAQDVPRDAVAHPQAAQAAQATTATTANGSGRRK